MLIKKRPTLKNAKVLLLTFLFFFVCTALPIISLAQAGFDAGTDGGTVGDTPIDGGVVLLIAAGVVFGVYMLYKQKKNQLVVGK